MPPQPERKARLLRIVVPIILLALGVVFAWAVFTNTTRQTRQAAPLSSASGGATQGATPQTGQLQPAAAGDASAPAAGDAAAPTDAPAAQPAPAFTGLRARPVEGDLTPAALTPIGSLDPDGDARLLVEFNPVGAGIEAIRLADHFKTVDRKEHDVVQETIRYTPQVGAPTVAVSSMAALAVSINDQVVDLAPLEARIWSQTGPGEFSATIEDDQGREVARVTRRYELVPGAYHLRLHQRVENLTGSPLRITWYQYGPLSLERGRLGYGGDPRRTRFGYLRSPATDPAQQYVQAGRFLLPQPTAREVRAQWIEQTLWPTRTTQNDSLSLVWTAMTNRYFGVAVFPLIDPATQRPDKRLHPVAEVRRFAVQHGLDVSGRPDTAAFLRLSSSETVVPASGSADLSMGIYAGPLSTRVLRDDPVTAAVGLDQLVVYTFGGPCGFCTFQSLTHGLLWMMRLWHDYIVFDWGLAIIMLVVCVRTILHPVTKWSQTSMYRFGKQMQALAPKQKRIQEQYKDDPKRMREEIARLMREEKINYAGALGCLPMFLQTPIWIALFAMLYFAFDLRHEPAFFGVFQRITGGGWHFLADLAEPDNAIPFGRSFWVPAISSLMGPISGINILPIILGLVFFVQQKYLTPPTTATLTPEQETQQKIMKVMIVVMFPLFMYNAPSGLALYFLTNSTLGIIESRHIRKHAEKVDAIKAARAKVSGPGRKSFMERLQEQIDARQKMLEQARARRAGGGGGDKRERGRGR
jgi:YidC/Oxa1 family membrane protein insertase